MKTVITMSIHNKNENPAYGKDVLHVTNDGEGIFTVEQINPANADASYFGVGKMALDVDEVKEILEVMKEMDYGER